MSIFDWLIITWFFAGWSVAAILEVLSLHVLAEITFILYIASIVVLYVASEIISTEKKKAKRIRKRSKE
jgi:hypothetical protein